MELRVDRSRTKVRVEWWGSDDVANFGARGHTQQRSDSIIMVEEMLTREHDKHHVWLYL